MVNHLNSHKNQRSPLYDEPPVESVHRLSELPLCGKVNLRGDASDTQFCKAVESATGLTLPFAANTHTTNNRFQLFWLGPDEWLLHLDPLQLEATLSALHTGMESIHHAITDVSDYFTVIALSGPQCREILASGTPLDIREERFQAGQCAQTLFGHASILLWPHDAQSYQLQVRWTYAHYLYTYLAQSIHNVEALNLFEKDRNAKNVIQQGREA